jgi:hypothetical protein
MYRAYMSLAAASAIAYAALRELMHPGQHRTSAAEYEEAMGLISAHISIVVPIFGALAEGEPVQEIARDVVAQGRFRWGGLRLEFDDGRASYVNLAIRKGELDPILERLRFAYAPLTPRSPVQSASSIKSMLTKARG